MYIVTVIFNEYEETHFEVKTLKQAKDKASEYAWAIEKKAKIIISKVLEVK